MDAPSLWLCWCLLWTHSQQFHVLPVLEIPELQAALQMGSRQSRAKAIPILNTNCPCWEQLNFFFSLWSFLYKVNPNNFSSGVQKFKAVLQMSGNLTSCLVDFLYCPITICQKTSQQHIVDKHVVNWIMLQIIGCAVKWKDSTDNIWK